MQHQEFAPPARLRDVIKCFWHNRRDFGEEPTSFEVVPDGYAEIIFHFGSELSIAIDAGWQPLPSPFLMGLLNQPAQLRTKGQFEVLAIRCFPWTVFELLGLPAGKGSMRIFEHSITQLHNTLTKHLQAGGIEAALAEVERYFLQARSRMTADGTLGKAGGAMRAAKGTLPVSQVAAAAHATVRTLERKFKQSAGHTVKDVSGLMRFEQVRNRLWLEPEVSLAGLAHELGYTDQAHLSRDFKRYSGTSPAAFARKTKAARQALPPDFVAFVQA
jgi:AraC-like DNA-binding protein